MQNKIKLRRLEGRERLLEGETVAAGDHALNPGPPAFWSVALHVRKARAARRSSPLPSDAPTQS